MPERGRAWSSVEGAPRDGSVADLRQRHPAGGWWVTYRCTRALDADGFATGSLDAWIGLPTGMRPSEWRPSRPLAVLADADAVLAGELSLGDRAAFALGLAERLGRAVELHPADVRALLSAAGEACQSLAEAA